MKKWLFVLIFCPALSFGQTWHIDMRAGAAFTQTSSDAVSGNRPALTWHTDLALRRACRKSFEYGLALAVQPLATVIKQYDYMYPKTRSVRYYFANPAFAVNVFIGGCDVKRNNTVGVGFGAGYCIVPQTQAKNLSATSITGSYGFGAKGWMGSLYVRDDYKVGPKVSVSAAIQPSYHSLHSEGKNSRGDQLGGYSVPLTLGISMDI